jgi:tetratricopeptide (TPR) repeat protein
MLNSHDSFFILQGNNTFYYQNNRIVKNNGLYSYSGVTHEYINTPPNNRMGFIKKNELFILDIGDGGCKQDKFERDIRLLTDGLIEEPNNERYYFYLANSYHDNGNYEKAIEIYEKRIQLGGWEQEIWYSYYRIGSCYQKLNKNAEAIIAWLNGYNHFPKRIENLYEISKHYRNISKHRLSEHFYNLANGIIAEKHDIDNYLFLHKDVYDFKLNYEFTIIAAYIGIHNINDKIISILNISNDSSINTSLLSNMKFYKDVLVSRQILKFDDTKYINVNGENTQFYSSSSSLIHNPKNNGYLMNVRYVNYYINKDGSYLNCDKHIVTVNRFVEFDKNFKLLNDKFFDVNFEDRRYVGIEDVRIFNDSTTDKIKFIGVGYHKNNSIGVVEGNYNIENNILESRELTCGFNNASCEKNWVYAEYNGSTHVIYKWHPLQICKVDEETQKLNLIESKDMPKIFSNIRGSTCGFKYAKNVNISNMYSVSNISLEFEEPEMEIWFVLHMVSYENPRHYYHIITVFDEKMNLLRYSAPFKFEGECIEYCLSIIVEDERVIINYSGMDRTTRIGIYEKTYIDSLLKYK